MEPAGPLQLCHSPSTSTCSPTWKLSEPCPWRFLWRFHNWLSRWPLVIDSPFSSPLPLGGGRGEGRLKGSLLLTVFLWHWELDFLYRVCVLYGLGALSHYQVIASLHPIQLHSFSSKSGNRTFCTSQEVILLSLILFMNLREFNKQVHLKKYGTREFSDAYLVLNALYTGTTLI